MGDLIQTTPAIVGLKEKYPGVRITLLVNTAFKEICNYLPFIDRYFHLDKRIVINLLDNNRILEAYSYIWEVLHNVNDREYDLVINFTHSSSSAIITSLIRAKEIRGLSIDREGYTMKRHPWIRYLFNVIPSRNINPFHLCDMHVKSAGVLPENKGLHLIVKDEMNAWAEDILKQNGLNKGEYLIAFQLGASAEDKRWPVENFASLADIISHHLDATILLTGSSSESGFGERFEDLTGAKTINLIGKTNLMELTALLKRADLLVSNDTGPLHIATAVGTTVVDISLASVHFRETGPYGDGHYVVTADIPCYPCSFQSNCSDYVCKKTITPEAVFELVKNILKDGSVSAFLKEGIFKDIQVYESYFDDDGLISYRPLIRRALKSEELFSHIYRKTWQVVLDRKGFPNPDSIAEHVIKKLNLYSDYSVLEESGEYYVELFQKLSDLIEGVLSIMEIMKKEASKGNPDLQLIERLWENIVPIDK
ncbi:MAG: glycosyltransferase family 9 protein, partial [Nitrospirae bacterium]|nr:glycosyltransferase family 9 protein [Nitrospirota bacterium]